MDREGRRRRLRHDVERWARAGLDVAGFAERLQHSVGDVVAHDAACVVTLDPTTSLLTGTYKFGALAGHHEQDRAWALLEYGANDPTAMAALAARGVAAEAVSGLPLGLRSSPRAQQLVEPAGFGDEVRLVAAQGGASWGGLNLFRGSDQPCFSADEVALLASLDRTVAAGLRSALVAGLAEASLGPVADGLDHGPAVVVVDVAGEIRQTSIGVEELLAELAVGRHRSPADALIESLVTAARRYAGGLTQVLPRARLRARSGRWLLAHASPLAGIGGSADDVVISLEEARPPEIVPLVAAAFGLNRRERDITVLVLQGHDTKAIASRLHLSPHTVQDHLKSVFAKAEVRSRRELVTRVFFEQYATRLGGPVSSSGWFAQDPAR